MSEGTAEPERWLPVVGYEESYLISDYGRVWSVPRLRTKGGILAASKVNGYQRVGLSGVGRARGFNVHALVAAAFIGPRPAGEQVRHLDGNPDNNHLSNLAYGTPNQIGLGSVERGTNSNTRKTHCPKGHPYDDANTKWYRGHRQCITCINVFRRANGSRYTTKYREQRAISGEPCTTPECTGAQEAKGLCHRCYERERMAAKRAANPNTGLGARINFKDRTGQRYGRLVVISRAPDRVSPKSTSKVYWLCQCDCGNKAEVWTYSLGRGQSKSCGCLAADLSAMRNPASDPAYGAKHVLRRTYRLSADRRGYYWGLTDEEFFALTAQPCFYCGQPPAAVQVRRNSTYIYNGVDRQDNSLGYTPENSVPCCKICNHAKGKMPYEMFIAWIGRLTRYQLFRPDVTPSPLLRKTG